MKPPISNKAFQEAKGLWNPKGLNIVDHKESRVFSTAPEPDNRLAKSNNVGVTYWKRQYEENKYKTVSNMIPIVMDYVAVQIEQYNLLLNGKNRVEFTDGMLSAISRVAVRRHFKDESMTVKEIYRIIGEQVDHPQHKKGSPISSSGYYQTYAIWVKCGIDFIKRA